jgi:hypothetical protein
MILKEGDRERAQVNRTFARPDMGEIVKRKIVDSKIESRGSEVVVIEKRNGKVKRSEYSKYPERGVPGKLV